MKLQHISQAEFNQIEGVRRIIVHDCPHQFALLDLGEPLGHYGISWRSSPIIQPVIIPSKDELTLWVGVDQHLAAIDLRSGRIRLSMAMHENIFNIFTMEFRTIVLTELELLLFNNHDCSIESIEDLPEIAAGMTVAGSDLVIGLIDGRSLTLNLETCKLQVVSDRMLVVN
ncbi:MAG: hypothetical protein AB4352_02700 [Hormoscilla sp.]